MDFYKRKEILRNDIKHYLETIQQNPKHYSEKRFNDVLTGLMLKSGFGRKKVLSEFAIFGVRYDEEKKMLVKP